MRMTPPGVATIAGDAEVDHASATLVLAFVTDPVAPWMYDVPDRYLLHIPRLFRALGKPSKEAQRSAPTKASGLLSGSHRGFMEMMDRSRW